jgi:hypothetical protein
MKYDPLRRYLESVGAPVVELSFVQIEEIIGGRLPESARKHPAWWSNNPTNHVNAQAWLAAGYSSGSLDLAGERLVFSRHEGRAGGVRPGMQDADVAAPQPGLVDRLRARLGGTVWIAPGVDLTAPTGEVWNAERD